MLIGVLWAVKWSPQCVFLVTGGHSERLHSKNTSNFGPTKDFAMVSISKA